MNGPFDAALSLLQARSSATGTKAFAARSPGARGGLARRVRFKSTPAIDSAVGRFLGVEPRLPTNPFANRPPDSPFYTPYDPKVPGRPDPARTVDSRLFKNPADFNAEGFPRDNLEFWRLWRARFPETLSPRNAYLLDTLGVSPEVDPTWVRFFPEHGSYKWQTLVHHHVVELPVFPTDGPTTMPVPSGAHVGSGGPIHGIP